MRKELQEKKIQLEKDLRTLPALAVAFSAGVDSTFLLAVAHQVLGDRVIAVTARSCSFPERERKEAVAFCQENGIQHFVCDSEELNIDGFRQNPKNRCYLCKSELFQEIRTIADAWGREKGFELPIPIAEGSNTDDNGDYRPGLDAVAEQGILSPLRKADLSKEEIRMLSKKIGLPTWDKQSFACLSSRFPYGEIISEEKLSMVDQAEQFLIDQGFHQVRVRIHEAGQGGYLARIEVEPMEFPKVVQEECSRQLSARFREIGFSYVSLDLEGYRTGSMNETMEERVNHDTGKENHRP